MMNKIWLIMLISGISTLLFINPAGVLEAVTNGAQSSVNLSIRLVALYAFWLGFFALLEKTGVSKVLSRLLRPLVKFLFPEAADDTKKFVTMNMSANILGLGNAATPMAIKAINSMDDGSGKASLNMMMLVVISATSLQLLPTTIIGLRADHGSATPADFLPASIVATLVATIIGVTLLKLWGRFSKKLAAKKEQKKQLAKLPLAEKSAVLLSK